MELNVVHSGMYNVVQLYIDNKPEIILGYEEHDKLLANTLIARRIPFERDSVYNFPKANDLRYQTHGMGNVEVNNIERIAIFSGWGHYYNRGIDRRHVELLRQYNPEWRIYIK